MRRSSESPRRVSTRIEDKALDSVTGARVARFPPSHVDDVQGRAQIIREHGRRSEALEARGVLREARIPPHDPARLREHVLGKEAHSKQPGLLVGGLMLYSVALVRDTKSPAPLARSLGLTALASLRPEAALVAAIAVLTEHDFTLILETATTEGMQSRNHLSTRATPVLMKECGGWNVCSHPG